MIFEPIKENNLHIAQEIYNSNPTYNKLENRKPTRSIEEVRKEFIQEKTESYIVYIDKDPVALIDFLPKHEKDGHPWLGFLMIHGGAHGKGIGSDVYQTFEKRLTEAGIETLRLAVLVTNDRGKTFWKSHGFTFYGMNRVDDNPVECYEKEL